MKTCALFLIIALAALTTGCDILEPEVDVIPTNGVNYGFSFGEVYFNGLFGYDGYVDVTNHRGEEIIVRLYLVTDDEDIPKTSQFHVERYVTVRKRADFYRGDVMRIRVARDSDGQLLYDEYIELR